MHLKTNFKIFMSFWFTLNRAKTINTNKTILQIIVCVFKSEINQLINKSHNCFLRLF